MVVVQVFDQRRPNSLDVVFKIATRNLTERHDTVFASLAVVDPNEPAHSALSGTIISIMTAIAQTLGSNW